MKDNEKTIQWLGVCTHELYTQLCNVKIQKRINVISSQNSSGKIIVYIVMTLVTYIYEYMFEPVWPLYARFFLVSVFVRIPNETRKNRQTCDFILLPSWLRCAFVIRLCIIRFTKILNIEMESNQFQCTFPCLISIMEFICMKWMVLAVH